MKKGKILKAIEDESIDDNDIYLEEARVLLVDDDELTPEEAAFMQGYEEAG